jgi:TRAP-type C4-dicarboxylate transport system permease small subunit
LRQTFSAIAALIDRLSVAGLVVSASLVAFLMTTQVLEVVLRSVGRPTTWVFDLNLTALLGVVFFGLAGAELGSEHVAVDFLAGKARGAVRRALVLINGSATVVFLLMLVWFGTNLALESLRQGRTTGGLFSIPQAIPEGLLPLGALLLAAQTIVQIVRVWTGAPDAPEPAHDVAGDEIGSGGDIVLPPAEPVERDDPA